MGLPDHSKDEIAGHGTNHAPKLVDDTTKGKNMEREEECRKQGQLEEHSLPGTNQAGKGPGPCEETDHKHRPDRGPAQDQDELGKRSTYDRQQRATTPETGASPRPETAPNIEQDRVEEDRFEATDN